MASKYIDTNAILQVIGCIYKNPALLEQHEKYFFNEDDFVESFHRTIFGSIYNLKTLGSNKIDAIDIENYLSNRPKKMAEYKAGKGDVWLEDVKENADLDKFDYFYGRVKKMSLLRGYSNFGVDVTHLYDPDNILDIKKKQVQEDWLDNATLTTIADAIDDRIEEIKLKYVEDENGASYQAGDGMKSLIQRLKETPEIGVPLYGNLINTITRGARLKKFYLRSAATGCGKTRTMIADACYIACNEIYIDGEGWIKNGTSEPTVFITTEQELEEIQTMMLAFISNVNEESILNGKYEEGEEERVIRAAEIIENSPLYVEELPDFSLRDIENTIKRNIREHGTKYIFMDYIHTSLKILEEITKRTGGMKLREDNILFMISIRLKDICNEYGVFITSATQLNGDSQDAKLEELNQNLLRGAKSIADKIDLGSIIMKVKEEDLVPLDNILSSGIFEKPTLKISIYKNRRGKFKSVILWCKADLGTCRVQPMFMTDCSYEMMSIDNVKIFVKDEEESAF